MNVLTSVQLSMAQYVAACLNLDMVCVNVDPASCKEIYLKMKLLRFPLMPGPQLSVVVVWQSLDSEEQARSN